MSIAVNFKVDPTSSTGTINNGLTVGALSQSMTVNSTQFPCAPVSFVTGAGAVLSGGALQVDDWYLAQLTTTTTATTSIDLNGSASYKDPFGTALSFTTLKLIWISLNAPDGVLSLQVGPQNVSNAFAGPWGAINHTTDYTTVYWNQYWIGPAAGWTVTASTGDLLPVTNPGGTSVVWNAFILGV